MQPPACLTWAPHKSSANISSITYGPINGHRVRRYINRRAGWWGVVRTERLSARATSVATRMAKDSSRNVASCASLAFLASSISCWCRLLACSGGTVVRGKGQPEEGVMEGMRLRRRGVAWPAVAPMLRKGGRGQGQQKDEDVLVVCVSAAWLVYLHSMQTIRGQKEGRGGGMEV